MKRTNLTSIISLTLLINIAMGITMAMAQSNDPAGPIDDNAAIAFFQKFASWQIFLVPIVTVLVQLLKKTFAQIPTKWLPWIAPILGAALQYVGSKFGLWTGNVAAGLAMGGLATWFFEFVSQTAAGKPGAGEGP